MKLSSHHAGFTVDKIDFTLDHYPSTEDMPYFNQILFIL